ncbi:hypothetical protein [Cryptosporangium sp. NPDC048952]|uniref:hypothetical protein n=1 Tax=Cryptosporangium sp. NPDC048952 TaxID=3363961 RepID=UPI003720610E
MQHFALGAGVPDEGWAAAEGGWLVVGVPVVAVSVFAGVAVAGVLIAGIAVAGIAVAGIAVAGIAAFAAVGAYRPFRSTGPAAG